jgi:hypothetical protein
MLRWVGVLLILFILFPGCITTLSGEKSRNSEGTANATESPTPAPANEETLAGNRTTIGKVTLSIDQSVYRVGEVVRGRFLFTGSLSIFPYMRILRFENGTWNFLGFFTFDGAQYVCCGMYPPCEEFHASESSPILLSWHQQLSGGELPAVINPANITTQPAGPGAYRFEVIYGTSSCMEGSIKAGFIIQ